MRQRSLRRFPVLLAALGASAFLLGLAGCAGRPEPRPEGWTASPPVRTAATLPSGFEDALVASLAAPTALAFVLDGRMLVTTQPGQLRVYQNGALLQSPALNLSGRLCTNSERGLLGVAVDPAFATNRFVYLYYTHNLSGVCEANTARSPVNRVSRFTLGADNVATGETILIDNIPSPNGNHNAGDLGFGRDGFLYVSVGDGGCDYAGNSGCAGANDAARDQNILLGKVLRVTRDGGIPADNPFLGADSARCNTAGRTTASRCQETYAWGLRNPFRMAFDPNASGTRFFINDVGQGLWEEINFGAAGADYGWNVREGRCANNSTTNCGAPPAGMTNPVYDYGHGSGCASITGGAFVPGGVWPASFDGAYLYGDYVCGKIFKLTPAAGGGYTASEFVSGLGGSSAVHLAFGPHGAGQALYYTTYANGGEVRRIAYTAANRNPVAAASASPTAGNPPLAVSFSASGSSDPDGDPLTYEWSFGDGTPGASGPAVSHTYSAAGNYTATLTVRDNRGGTGTATVRISVGNTAPAPRITAPTTARRFRVGETITLSGSATDAQDGALPASSLSWQVLLHHLSSTGPEHTHPLFSGSGNNLTFAAPAPEDLDAAVGSYVELRLTATDSQGLSSTTSQRLDPNRVSAGFQTSPSGFQLTVNGVSFVAPRTLTSWEGYNLNVNAPSPQPGKGKQRYAFSSWSDRGAAAHTIVTPASAATYTATYVRQR